jgi:hypothetical protein
MQRPERWYGTLNGCLQNQLQRLLKIKLLNEHCAFVEYCFALALTAIPEKLGNLDSASHLVQVRNAPAVVRVSNRSG